MKKCLVIGGGFAGLTASAYLINSGFNVELIESSPKLGGRAYSFLHKGTNTLIDNGQHIMMGCYKDTLKFLELINALDKIEVQKNLSVNFVYPNFNLHQLKTSSLPYPLNLLTAILKYSAVSLRERISIFRLFLKLPFFAQRDLSRMSVDDLLKKENQNEDVKKAFWEIICVGALNTNLNKASAKIFVDILKEIFLKGSKGSKIVLPKFGLSEVYCEPAKQFVEQKGGMIFLSERVEEIKIVKAKAVEVITDKRRIADFDYVICAVPFYAFEKIVKLSENDVILRGGDFKHSSIQAFPQEADRQPQYSSILNVHIWLKRNGFGNNFYGLIGSKIHWVFAHDHHLTCVISDADYLMNLIDDEIMKLIYSELEKYLNISKDEIINHFIVKEKRATFIPSNEILYNRPASETEVKNIFLAGDWVNTGFPSTIESAAKSGRQTVELIKSATL